MFSDLPGARTVYYTSINKKVAPLRSEFIDKISNDGVGGGGDDGGVKWSYKCE